MDPDGRELKEGSSVSEQLSYLKSIAYADYATSQAKADAAKSLRTEMRNLHPERFNLDELFLGKDGNEKFMNEDLRDFLNTSDDGTAFRYRDIVDNKAWEEIKAPGNSEHQRTARGTGYQNKKFVNKKDGREAIFSTTDGKNWTLITGGSRAACMDKGTYNYAKNYKNPLQWSEHARWDMAPFYRQYSLPPPGYWLFLKNRYRYNMNGK